MLRLIVGLFAFLGSHSISVFANDWRNRTAARLGPNLWRGLYSLVALASFYLLIVGFAAARREPVVLYVPVRWMHDLALLLMLPVFPMLIASGLPGKIRSTLKHPMLVGVKTWAVAHLLANGMLADVLLFGGFLAWAVIVRISLKRRVPRPMRLAPERPYNDLIAIVVGLIIYAAFIMGLHRLLLGVSPL